MHKYKKEGNITKLKRMHERRRGMCADMRMNAHVRVQLHERHHT